MYLIHMSLTLRWMMIRPGSAAESRMADTAFFVDVEKNRRREKYMKKYTKKYTRKKKKKMKKTKKMKKNVPTDGY